MILVEIRRRGGDKETIAVHSGLTVIRGLDAATRRTWASELARALQGETEASLDVEVEVNGERRGLSPELVSELGLRDAAAVTVFAVDLPGAKPAPDVPTAPAAEPPGAGDDGAGDPDPAALEVAVASADRAVAQLRAQLADAERASTSASDELTSAGRHRDRDAPPVAAAEAALEAARAAAASARQELEAAADAARGDADADAAASAEAKERVQRLQKELSALESERSAIVGRMVEGGDPGDPAPVEQALAGLRRLRSVKPRPSPKAVELADRWARALEQLASLPQPPQPPEWLVTPALAALHEAREALAEATSGIRPEAVDPEKVEALDRAHREVLEAEQRAMKKGSRLNRRRLDAAHEAEQTALAALGVKSYGEYLQRIAPALEGGGSSEDRAASARAALADAEAVWEELHGGLASPEWTAAKEQQAEIRTEALALLGRDVEDHELEDELRNHLETVVDTEWAEQALVTALRQAGATVVPGDDIEAAAEAWLAEAPALLETRVALEAELGELDARLSKVEEELAQHQADAFFGDDLAEGGTPAGDAASSAAETGRRAAVRDAEAAERAAEAALATAKERQAGLERERARLHELEVAADARRDEADRLRKALAEAEAAAAQTRARVDAAASAAREKAAKADRASRAAEAATAADAATPAPVDLSGVVGMEAEAYLLARVAALRGAAGGPLPLVVDGDAVTGLTDGASRRVLRLIGRLAGSMQVVVLSDDERIATWAEGLGDQAAVRQAAAR